MYWTTEPLVSESCLGFQKIFQVPVPEKASEANFDKN